MYLIMEMLETDLWKLISEYHNFSPFNVLQIRNIAWQVGIVLDIPILFLATDSRRCFARHGDNPYGYQTRKRSYSKS